MSGYFEGWYFKQQKKDHMVALIPAIHTDGWGRSTGSIQIVTPDKSWCVSLKDPPDYKLKPALSVKADGSSFSAGGLELDIRHPEITVSGSLRFSRLTAPLGDIMGPFRFVPFMECRHSVFSVAHSLEGSLTLNGALMDFTGGIGYIEGDRGRSFPKKYVWTQYSWEDDGPGATRSEARGLCSLMLSAADVRPFGIPFIGIIGFVYFRGREYRIATYRGAKILSAGNGAVSVRQGDYTLTARLLDDGGPKRDSALQNAPTPPAAQALRAPVSGEMTRLIKESLACRARYTFSVKERVLFDYVAERASFEYEF